MLVGLGAARPGHTDQGITSQGILIQGMMIQIFGHIRAQDSSFTGIAIGLEARYDESVERRERRRCPGLRLTRFEVIYSWRYALLDTLDAYLDVPIEFVFINIPQYYIL